MRSSRSALAAMALLSWAVLGWEEAARGDVGDPQIRSDHPWYPGELAMSTFPRLFATQAEQYALVTGKQPTTDEERALASWLFRNTHYAHAEEGAADLWGAGFGKGGDTREREYWTGLFAHGFGLCGTTHSQWTAEMEQLFGHGRGRGLGVNGHNSFEVFLAGGKYGEGKWALLDHDLSTVIYSGDGSRLLGLKEVQADWKRLTSREHAPQRQQGWLVCGLHPGDAGSYSSYNTAEYLAGYSGPPPMVHLRRGEVFRRYFAPGLSDGKTFVFWGRNYREGGIPGPARSITWVNQPEKMHGSREGAGHHPGQARYGNAVYVYRPDFSKGDYREGVVRESDKEMVLSFQTPYVIAATPPDDSDWGIYKPGCRGGLVLRGKTACQAAVSVDGGATWQEGGKLEASGLDLTDRVKGFRQYLLRLSAGGKELVGSELEITTVCQLNAASLPRLKDVGATVTFARSGEAVSSVGPTKAQAAGRIVAGALDSPTVTLAVESPHGEAGKMIYAAAHVASGNPPSAAKYAIEVSSDGGKTWQNMVKDWSMPRRGEEPDDFWSQSLCYGSAKLSGEKTAKVLVRFQNNGGRKILRAEAHLVHATGAEDGTKVTYSFRDSAGEHLLDHTFSASGGQWKIPTAQSVTTNWVEFSVALSAKPAP